MIKELGFPRQFSCARFETKHRTLKQIAHSVASRVNIALTLTKRNQLELIYRFLMNKGFNPKIKYGKILTQYIHLLPKYELFKYKILENVKCNYEAVSWIMINGIYFSRDLVVVVSKNFNSIKLGKIVYILTNKQDCSKAIFIYIELSIIKYQSHIYTYKVQKTNSYNSISHKNSYIK